MPNQLFESNFTEDIAATLFWTFVSKVGFAAAIDNVIATRGRGLFEQLWSANVLNGIHGLPLIPLKDRPILVAEVSDKAFRSAKENENLVGMVYVEDAMSGRSPSAIALDTATLNIKVSSIEVNGIERVGKLCVRHPLPAVVFSSSIADVGLIQVQDTSTALGFPYPIFLEVDRYMKAPGNQFVLTGIFKIPVPNDVRGDEWQKVIPNAVFFKRSMLTSAGSLVDVAW